MRNWSKFIIWWVLGPCMALVISSPFLGTQNLVEPIMFYVVAPAIVILIIIYYVRLFRR